MPSPTEFTISDEERRRLESMVRSQRGRAADARRARIILLVADGHSYRDISERVGCSAPTISLWKQRFVERRSRGCVPAIEAARRGW